MLKLRLIAIGRGRRLTSVSGCNLIAFAIARMQLLNEFPESQIG